MKQGARAFLLCVVLAGALPLRPEDASISSVCTGEPTTISVEEEAVTRCVSKDDIAPSPAFRQYIAFDVGGRELTLGRLAADSVSFPERGTLAIVDFSITSRAGLHGIRCSLLVESAPAPAATSSTWQLALSADASVLQRKLLLPEGSYALSLDCEHYEPLLVNLTAKRGPIPLILRESLKETPLLSGRVVSEAGGVVADIEDELGQVLGRSAPNGEFRIELSPQSWPRQIRISAPGYGSEIVGLPASSMVFELPEVRLLKSGRIAIRGSEEQLRSIKSVEVLKLINQRGKKQFLTRDAEELRKTDYEIFGVPAGTYLVVLRGDGPLEKFGVKVDVQTGQVAFLDAGWSVHDLTVRTFLGEEKLADAEIKIESLDALWDVTFNTISEGEFHAELWQPGVFIYLLSTAGSTFHSGEISLTPPSAEFRVPTRTVEGVVVDELTGEPIGEINVVLFGEGTVRRSKAEKDGRFRFVGVNPGSFQVSAGGELGFSQESIPVVISEDSQTRGVRLKLQQRRERSMEIVRSNGAPAVAATVVEVADNAVIGRTTADSRGAVRLPVRPHNRIIVIDADGTMHAHVLTSEAKGSNVSRVQLTAPTANITIRLETDEGQGIEGISLAMRVNDVLVPVQMIGLLNERVGLNLRSAVDGWIHLRRLPVGKYEFWPVRSRADAEAILSGRPGPAPVLLNVSPGENVARLTFARVEGNGRD